MIDSQVGNRPELRRTWLEKLEIWEVQEMEDKGWSASDYKEGYKLMTWKERNKDIRKLAQLVVIRHSRMAHEISTSAQILFPKSALSG